MAPTQFVEVRLHSSCTVLALLYPKPQYMTNKNISKHHVLWTLIKSSFLSFPSIHLFLQTSSKIVLKVLTSLPTIFAKTCLILYQSTHVTVITALDATGQVFVAWISEAEPLI